jgi:hypothetical protein
VLGVRQKQKLNPSCKQSSPKLLASDSISNFNRGRNLPPCSTARGRIGPNNTDNQHISSNISRARARSRRTRPKSTHSNQGEKWIGRPLPCHYAAAASFTGRRAAAEPIWSCPTAAHTRDGRDRTGYAVLAVRVYAR